MSEQAYPGWRLVAACRDADPMLFFGGDDESQVARVERERAALAVCASCVARTPCAEFAVVTGARHGVWGGLTEDMRDRAVRAARAPRGPRPRRRP